ATKPGQEVAAPEPTGLLQRGQDGIERRKAARDALGEDGLARQDAVPRDKLLGDGTGALGSVDLTTGPPLTPRLPVAHAGERAPARLLPSSMAGREGL